MSKAGDDRPPTGTPGTSWPQPASEILLVRALRLRCPRCGAGRMFQSLVAMHPRCPHCRLKFNREPGYFLGSSYINYGLTAVALVIAYSVLHFRLRFSNHDLALPLSAFCVLFPIAAFRHARALWLALDCRWDSSLMVIDDET